VARSYERALLAVIFGGLYLLRSIVFAGDQVFLSKNLPFRFTTSGETRSFGFFDVRKILKAM
jgi:hypothetical protein